MKHILGVEGTFHAWSFVLTFFFALLVLHNYFMLTDQGHDQDLDHLPILGIMAVVHILKAVIVASQRLRKLSTLLSLEAQMTEVNQKLQGFLLLHLQYELTYLSGRET
jgi:uncharacterized membrane protein